LPRKGKGVAVKTSVKEILLVEDNPADVALVQKALEHWERTLHLSVAPDGGEALAFLRKEGRYAHAPALALLMIDLNVPKIMEQGLLVELRRLPAYQATPAVVFSAAEKEIAEPLCLQLGATAYVQKPFELDQFLATVQAIMRRWLLQDIL